jgi:3-phosphoshikimate 1-carboxyvinyltransferase
MQNVSHVNIPASKSISNRVLVLAAFKGEGKIIRNILKSEDTQVMFNAFETLGVKYEILSENDESIDIKILNTVSVNSGEFFMNNSGTSTRFLIPCLALIKGEFRLDGTKRMRERPISDLASALSELGVEIEFLGENGYLPLKMTSKGKLSGTASIKCDLSSQYLSGLMLAQDIAGNSFDIKIIGDKIVSKPYIDLTDEVIREFNNIDSIDIESDYSSASYFVAMGVVGEQKLYLDNMNADSLQADKEFIRVLIELGADIKYIKNGLLCSPSKLSLLDRNIDCSKFPDSAMTLVIVCAVSANVKTKLYGLSTLKHKECDRLKALHTELAKIGVKTEIDDDSMIIYGVDPVELRPAKIATYDDHRMAMCFAVLKLLQDKIEILNPEVVNKTFPTFWNKLRSVTEVSY